MPKTVIYFSLIVCALTIILLYIRDLYIESFISQSQGPLKVHFNGFWDGIHERNTVQYFIDLLSAVYKQPVTEGSESESQILMESMFGDTKINAKRWMHTYHYTGEPDIRANAKDFTVALSGYETGLATNNIGTPYYASVLYEINPIPDRIETPRRMPLKDVVCIISNPGGGVRNAFLNELDKHFQVTYAGKYKNNIGGPLPHMYLTREFIDYISQFKFIISMENAERDCYITEKVLHGIRAGIIPVYWGAKRTADYINPARIIHLKNEEAIADTIRRMKEVAASETLWQSIVGQPWKSPGKPQPTPEYTAGQIRKLLKLD